MKAKLSECNLNTDESDEVATEQEIAFSMQALNDDIDDEKHTKITIYDKLCNCEINVTVSVLAAYFIDVRLSNRSINLNIK